MKESYIETLSTLNSLKRFFLAVSLISVIVKSRQCLTDLSSKCLINTLTL